MSDVGASPYFGISRQGDSVVLAPAGDWRIRDAARIDAQLGQFAPDGQARLVVDMERLRSVDTAGAWLIYRTIRDMHAAGGTVEAVNASPGVAHMLQQAAQNDHQCEIEPEWQNPFARVVRRVGRTTVQGLVDARSLIAFVGAVTEAAVLSILRPWRIRWTSLVHNLEQTTLNAVPIVALISFLIGVVLAYQGAQQLVQFGAQIFVVDLIAISVLREISILLTAIIVAGRSGSAFTAQIGSMNVNEEVDAMRTLGLDPLEVLVLPRLFALVIGLPLLAFVGDIMGPPGRRADVLAGLRHLAGDLPRPAAGGGRVLDGCHRADQGAGLRHGDRGGRLLRRNARRAQCRERRPAHHRIRREGNLPGDRPGCHILDLLRDRRCLRAGDRMAR